MRLLFIAALVSALVSAQDGDQDYSDIPVKMPDIVIPQPETGKAHTPLVKAAALPSSPYTFYALAETADADKLAEDSTIIPGIGVIPQWMPPMDQESIEAAAVSAVNIAILSVYNPEQNTAVATVQAVDIAVPSVYSPAARIKAWMDFRRNTLSLFRDRRMVEYDKGLTPSNPVIDEWVAIYREYGKTSIEHVLMPESIRMIAEVRCPSSQAERETIRANLAFYAGLGYTSALLAIYGTENDYALRTTVSDILEAGMKVWFALSGRESLTDSLFVRPGDIDRCFSIVAPKSEGMLLGWRRTSVHLFLMDPEYANFLMSTARKYKADLAVLGEGYYGQTALSGHRTNSLAYNMPAGVSGCALVGVGYSMANAALAVNRLFAAVSAIPRVAVVLGDRPYYATRNSNGLSFKDNLDIKQRIERRFLEAGCIGTITIHGDGSDGMYDKRITDCLCTYPAAR